MIIKRLIIISLGPSKPYIAFCYFETILLLNNIGAYEDVHVFFKNAKCSHIL
jgi:hypothetical protein